MESYIGCIEKEILGQELDALDILRVLVNDYDECESKIIKGKDACAKLYKKRYAVNPYCK